MPTPPETTEQQNSAPSTPARVLAFASVIIAGVCGGIIGFSVMDIGCRGECHIAASFTSLAAASAAAVGTAVVAVLVLRSSAEWSAHRQAAPYQQPASRRGRSV